MPWSKLRAQLDRLRAQTLVGRLEIHTTRYRSANDRLGRAWVTFDNEEIVDLSDLRFEREYYSLADALRDVNDVRDFTNPAQRAGYYAAYDDARRITSTKGNFARFHFIQAARHFLSLSIAEALNSTNPLIRALAVIDRRVGQRRLRQLAKIEDENPIVLKMIAARCAAEGLKRASANNPLQPTSGSRAKTPSARRKVARS